MGSNIGFCECGRRSWCLAVNSMQRCMCQQAKKRTSNPMDDVTYSGVLLLQRGTLTSRIMVQPPDGCLPQQSRKPVDDAINNIIIINGGLTTTHLLRTNKRAQA